MRFILFLLLAGSALAQPVITVESAASGPAGVPASAVAPGSIVLIQQLRGGPGQIGGDLSRYAVQVRALPDGAPVSATILGARASSVLALLPKEFPTGVAEVVLTVEGQASVPAQVRVARVAAGLFASAGAPLGPALAQNVRADSRAELNALTTPAIPGDYLILWGTGLGETPMRDVVVELGGASVAPDYAGPAPGLPGVDQINVRVPADVPDDCYVSVRLRTPDSVSNEVTVATASTRGVCRHPLGLTQAQLQDLDANRSVRVVTANLRSEVMPPAGPPSTQPVYTRNGAATVEFAMRSPLDVFLIAQPHLREEAYYSCRLQNSLVIPRLIFVDDFDAGPKIDVTGPGGKALEATNEGVPILYLDVLDVPEPKVNPAELPEPFFSEGTWTFSGPGGKSVAPFSADLILPPPLQVTNWTGLQAIDRSQDQVVTWSPAGYTERDVLTVTLTNRFVPQPVPEGIGASTVVCRAPATAGRLTLPSALLRQIPESPGVLTTMASTLELRLASRPERRKIVDLPLTNGAPAKMVLDYLYSELRAVTIR